MGISALKSIIVGTYGGVTVSQGLSVRQAYDLDTKMDDGLPVSGGVMILYGVNQQTCTADGAHACSYPYNGYSFKDFVGPLMPSATTCGDNGGNNNGQVVYSLGTAANYGAGINCALSFKLQP